MNQAIFYFFYNFAHQSAALDQVIVFFAVYFPYVVFFAAAVFLVMHHEVFKAETPFDIFLQKKKEILRAFWVGALAWVLAKLLKLFIHIPRPFVVLPNVHALVSETGFAFPSGHATFFMALAVSIFFTHRKAGYWFIFFAFIIGLARVAGGVHTPVDILGGFILGGVIAYLFRNV